MGVYLYSKLPSEYQEVEYVQSSGTQYIDTGLPPSNNTKVQFKLSNYSINSSIQYVFGSTSRRGNNMFGLLGTTSWSGDTINGHLLYGTSEYKLSSGNIGNGGTHTGELSSNGFYVDGTRIRTVSGTFTGTLNMTIFAGNINGIIGANEKGSFKLYYFKVYESGTLVRDFVPCYRKSDDVIGLYDLVNNQFYTNSGTGIFSKGADVTAVPLKNAYIGEVHTYTFDFQNDGDLGWTGFTKRGTPSYVSGQGWTIGTDSTNAFESGITPPSSIYKGTLRQVKIWFSKNNVQTSSRTQGAGICNSDLSIYCHYSHPRSAGPAILYVNGNSYFTNATNISGEIYISYIFNDDNSMVVDTNGTTYNIGNYASVFRGLWANKNLCLDICRWGTAAPYIRKVQIETS